MRIFHTGDLHLDSAFVRMSRDERIEARAHQRDIFNKMIKYVSDNRFDMLLIGGDLFDGRNITPETEECVIKGFSSLSCPVVISPGNHDPFALTAPYFKEKLPENVSVFNSSEVQVLVFEELGALVCGYAFESSNIFDSDPLADFTPPEFDGVSILCAHGELNVANSRFAPLSEAEIADIGFAYAALGHVHTSQIVRRGDSVIAYCGVIEGRAFDELGECGALEVTLGGGKVTEVKRVILGEKVYFWDTLDIGTVDSSAELIEYIEKYIESRGYGEDTALRLTLEGEADAALNIDKSAIKSLIERRLMYAEVVDKTRPRLDFARLEADFTLRGELYRSLRSELEGDDAERRRIAAEALRCALAAVDGREIR